MDSFYVLKKEKLSFFLLLGLTLISLGAMLLSDIFQAPILDAKESLGKYRSVVSKDKLNLLSSITLENKIGTFSLEKNRGVGLKDGWKVLAPRSLPAREQFVNNLKEELAKISIRRVFTKDPINILNYSLDRPQLRIKLGFHGLEDELIELGLINPANSSAYIQLSSKAAIYQVDLFSAGLEKVELADIIDPYILPFSRKEVMSIEIRGKSELFVERDQTNWRDKKGTLLLSDDVDDLLGQLEKLKSSVILDKIPETISDKISFLEKSPQFILKIKNSKEEEVELKASVLYSKLKSGNIELEKSFIVLASHQKHPFIVDGNFYKLFFSKLRPAKLPIDKIIY